MHGACGSTHTSLIAIAVAIIISGGNLFICEDIYISIMRLCREGDFVSLAGGS